MGNPVIHWEFSSPDPERLGRFYESVFDWNIKHIPEINYRLATAGGSEGIDGGIAPPEEGSNGPATVLYIGVADLAHFRDKVAAAGGKILVPQIDVPNTGSFALFADPDGRVVGLWKRA